MKKTIKYAGIGLVVVLVGLLVVGVTIVLAQGDATDESNAPDDRPGRPVLDREAIRKAAREAALAEIADQAVEQGLWTEEEAAEFLENPPPPRQPQRQRPFHGFVPGVFDGQAAKEALAEALGLSVEALDEAREAGQTLDELADQQGITPEALREAMEAARAAAIEQALQAGILTESQAEWLLANPGRRHPIPGYTHEVLARDVFNREDLKSALADALNLSVEALDEARQAGQTLPELIEQQGLTNQEVREAMEAAWQEAVDEALARELITETQAERLLAHPWLDRFRAGPRPFSQGERPFGRPGAFGPARP